MKKFATLMALMVVGLTAGPAAAQYPPGAAAITLSDATLACPAPVTVSGENFGPNEAVTVSVDGDAVGSATTDAAGSFSVQVSVAGASGTHTITASNSESASALASCVAAAPPGLAVTGGSITVGLVLLGALLAAATVALLAGRRRARARS